MGGELSPELEAEFDLTSGDLRAKIDKYHHVIDAFAARAEYFAQIEASAKAAKKIFENQRERLRQNLRYTMEASGEEELQGNDWRYRLCRGKEKLELDLKSLPPGYMREKVVLEPDREQIATELSMGFEVPGAALVESNSLRAYVNVEAKARPVKEISDADHE